MTITEDLKDNAGTCPFCESNVAPINLGRLGLSPEELVMIAEHTRNGTLGDMLRIGEIALCRIDPENTRIEYQVNEAISKLKQESSSIIKILIDETQLFVGTLHQSTQTENRQIVKEYEQKYAQVIRDLQNQIVDITRQLEKNRGRESNKKF
jgi:hypothetical protein